MKGNKEKVEIQKELEKFSPLLAKLLEKDAGFKVPENYFQQLPEEILEKARSLAEPVTSPVKPSRNSGLASLFSALQLLLRPRYAMGMAAITLLIVAGLFWLRPEQDGLPGDIAWSDISMEEMTKYVEANIQDFDLSSLVELAPGIEGQSILHGVDLEEEALDGYLNEMIEELEFEDLKYLF